MQDSIPNHATCIATAECALVHRCDGAPHRSRVRFETVAAMIGLDFKRT